MYEHELRDVCRELRSVRISKELPRSSLNNYIQIIKKQITIHVANQFPMFTLTHSTIENNVRARQGRRRREVM